MLCPNIVKNNNLHWSKYWGVYASKNVEAASDGAGNNLDQDICQLEIQNEKLK